MSHLAHMLRMRRGQVEDTTDETRIENYVKRNENQPSRVYPVYHLDPMFKAPKHFAYIMDFNEVQRQEVGRSSTCEVHLRPDILSTSDMKLISRKHAAFITGRDGGMRIQDVSVNGTMINGEFLNKDNRKCYPGDVITFGGPRSGAQYLLSLLEMGYSGHDVEDETVKWVTKSAEQLLEEAEDQIAHIPYRELHVNDIPRVRSPCPHLTLSFYVQVLGMHRLAINHLSCIHQLGRLAHPNLLGRFKKPSSMAILLRP